MTTNPWMKFYPTAWRSDAALRAVSSAARGLWIDMLSLMHEAEPYGHLVINGTAIEPRIVAKTTGNSPRNVREWLSELERAGVFSRTENGTIYSRRMVRDYAKAIVDKQNGSSGGNPNIKRKGNGGVNPPPNPEPNGGDKAKILEARREKIEEEKKGKAPLKSPKGDVCEPPGFAAFWSDYPKKTHKPAALRAYANALKQGITPELILDLLQHSDIHQREPRWRPHPASWLNANPWQDGPDTPRQSTSEALRERWNLGNFLAPGGYVAPNFDDDDDPQPTRRERNLLS